MKKIACLYYLPSWIIMAVIVITRPGDASLINGIQSTYSNLLLYGFHPFNYNSFNLTRDFLNTVPYVGCPALMVLLTVTFCILHNKNIELGIGRKKLVQVRGSLCVRY